MSLKECYFSLKQYLKHRSIEVSRILISRLLFILFCIGAAWQLVLFVEGWYPRGWYFLFLLLPLIAESICALYRKDHNQRKWFMPHVLCFLFAALPPMWLLEMDFINSIDSANITQSCSTTKLLNESDALGILEQGFIFIIILAKWLLPKKKMTLDDLTQLLLANIAAGADLVEFISPLKDNDCSLIRSEGNLIVAVGVATAWSLIQFPLNLNAKKTFPEDLNDPEGGEGNSNLAPVSRKRKIIKVQPLSQNQSQDNPKQNQVISHELNNNGRNSNLSGSSAVTEVEIKANRCSSLNCNFYCFYNETWGLLLCILFQDGPFLIIRLAILFYYKFFSSANVFFALKNLFVILLNLNRVRAIYKEQRQPWLSRMS